MPYRNHLFCAGCGHRFIRSVRAGRVLWECDGKRRFRKRFCEGVCITDDEVRGWEPIEDDIYVSEIRKKGKVLGHEFVDGKEWNQNELIDNPPLRWQEMATQGDALERYRGRLFLAMSKEGKLEKEIPEMTRCFLEEIVIEKDMLIRFLDGSEIKGGNGKRRRENCRMRVIRVLDGFVVRVESGAPQACIC